MLPQIDRRIPMSFLQRGFEENWNQAGFLEMLRIENKVIQYRWHPKLSQLYKMQRENTLTFDIEDVDFPAIVVTKTTLGTGWVQDPIIAPATSAPKTPYVSLKLDLECLSSTTIDATGPDNIDLPRTFWAEIRLHLSNVGGIMIYEPHITTSLELEEHVLWVEVDLAGKLKEKEREIFAKQWGENGRNHFDAILRPWFVGHYEVIEVEYDPATDDIVIWHIGKPVEQQAVAASAGTVSGGGAAPANLTPLFATAEDEKFAPSSTIGVDPTPLRPLRTSPGNLSKIEHIVVLMQENRSFDQVLGYLSRDGLPGLGVQTEVEGLLPGANTRDVNEHRFRPIADPKKFRQHAQRRHQLALRPRQSLPQPRLRQRADERRHEILRRQLSPAPGRRGDGSEAAAHHGLFRARCAAGLCRADARVRHLRPLVRIAYRRHPAQPPHHAERRAQPRSRRTCRRRRTPTSTATRRPSG